MVNKTSGRTGQDSAEEGQASPAPNAVATWAISLSSLRAGMCLTENLYDDQGAVLLPAGDRIAAEWLEALQQRGIHVVHIGCSKTPQGGEALRGRYERQLDDVLGRLLAADRRKAGRLKQPKAPLSAPDLADEAKTRLNQHAEAAELVEAASRSCCAGATRLPAEVERTIREFISLISVDSALLATIVAMQEPQNEYLFDHCVNVSLLSMTMGGRLGLSHEQIQELGMGTLLQDVGMLRVPEAIRLAPRSLTPDERIEMERHALHTLDSLQRLEGIPAVVPFVGYQAHERIDGSGYPRGRSGMFIHAYAKIAAVADVFSAMTHPRPHRPAFLPYLAVREILLEGNRGRLDRSAVRAFLDCVSLFPIGSYVELSNNVRARVARANPGHHTRPLVMEVNERGEPTGAVIDLLKDDSCYVVRAIPSPGQSHRPLVVAT